MKNKSPQSGSTLIEMLVTVGVVAIAGSGFFWVLYTISMLSARNDAVNVSHQEARLMINHAVQGIHNSLSVPILVDTNFATVATRGPAAGVEFQQFVCGPGVVTTSAAVGATSLTVKMSSPYDPDPTTSTVAPAPVAQMRIVFPTLFESDISSVSGSWSTYPSGSGTYTFGLSTPLTSAMTVSGGPTAPVPVYAAYVTQRSALVVLNGNLLYYPNSALGVASTQHSTIAYNVTTPTPFSIPCGSDPPTLTSQEPVLPTTPPSFQTPDGNNQYIQINLATKEPNATGRGYHNVDIQTIVTLPYRYKMTTIQ